MNTNAFPNGTMTWRGLDRIIDEIDEYIAVSLCDLDREEKLYILAVIDDCVSNYQYDLAPKGYTDRVLPFPLVEPPTPMFCDHCGEPVACDGLGILVKEVGSFQHVSGFFGCEPPYANVAEVDGKSCLQVRR